MFSLPWLGYVYLVLTDPVLWLLLLGSAAVLAALVAGSVLRARRTPATPVRVGAEVER